MSERNDVITYGTISRSGREFGQKMQRRRREKRTNST